MEASRPAVQRVNVDFTAPMLNELDREAETLNISRQAVIETMLREAPDRRYLAQEARQTYQSSHCIRYTYPKPPQARAFRA